MSLQDLTTSDGAALLASLPPYNKENVFSLTKQLQQKRHPAKLISEALTQSRLRAKAIEKFPSALAKQMFFTIDGIEQATRYNIALQHAAHLKNCGVNSIIDFGCGIGADSLGFAQSGMEVIALEIDLEASIAATHNLASTPKAKVIHADGRNLDLQDFASQAIWIDPARRKNGRRILNPQQWSPALDTAIKMARQFDSAGIKVAPGIAYEQLPADAFVTWISYDGNLLEAVIWLGMAAPKAGRAAWIMQENNCANSTMESFYDLNLNPQTPPIFCNPKAIQEYIYEPDPAIIRAGLVHQLAAEYDMSPISDKIAYLSANSKMSSSAFQCFKLREILPLNPKKAGKRLKELEIGRVEIKKRGTDISPEAFRKSLNLNSKAQNSAILIASPVMGRHQLLYVERCV